MAAAFPGDQACAVPGAFQLAWAHAGARRDALALRLPRRVAAVYLGPAAADESVVLAVGHLDVPAKYLGVARDFLLVADLDFQWAVGALLVEQALRGAQARHPVRRLPAALQRVVSPLEPLVELGQLQAARLEPQDE